MKLIEQIETIIVEFDFKRYWKVFVISLLGVYWVVSLPLILWAFDRLPEPLAFIKRLIW